MILAWVLAAFPIAYAVYIVAHALALFIIKPKRPLRFSAEADTPVPTFSLIIPMRNELQMLERLFAGLALLPRDGLEIVLVDDHSTDRSLKVAENLNLVLQYPIQILQLPKELQGKKAALAYGIQHTSNDWIVTTDADCVPVEPDKWLWALRGYATEGCQCIVGPIKKTHDKSLFQQAQALESAGLVALAGGAIQLGMPTLSNGANLAFRRSAFEAVQGYRGIDQVASGDDELLLHKIVSRFGARSVAFAASFPSAVVETPAESSFKSLLDQRLRWVSKSRAYKNPFISVGQLLAYFSYVSLVVLTVFSFFIQDLFLVVIGAWVAKLVAEFVLLTIITKSLGQLKLMSIFLLYQLPYLIYVLFIGIAGNAIRSYRWKDRNVV